MQDIILHKIDFLNGGHFPVYKEKVPSRMMYLREEAYQALKKADTDLPFRLFFSDIYRSPASSVEAYKNKIGVQRPGYSGHNYGVSIDLDIESMITPFNLQYGYVCEKLIQFGWTPYQGIQGPFKRGKEDWHFNCIGNFATLEGGSSQINNWIARNITFDTDLISIQKMLASLKFYHGEFDGVSGPLMKEAIKKFKQAWLPVKLLSGNFLINSDLDDLTIRTINIVSGRVLDENSNLII